MPCCDSRPRWSTNFTIPTHLWHGMGVVGDQRLDADTGGNDEAMRCGPPHVCRRRVPSTCSRLGMATPAALNAREAQNALQIQAKVRELFECVQAGEIKTFQNCAKSFPLGSDGATLRSLRDEYGRSMLHHAAQMGRHKMCEYLIDDYKFEVNDQDTSGEPALCLAAATNSDKVVTLLLAKGANPNLRKEPTGTAPIHRAAAAPGTHALKALLEAGADVSVLSGTGSALCWAASAGRDEAVKLLLARGASPNLAPAPSTDSQGALSAPGASPLCMAAGACSPACVSLLLAGGADVHARARGGATALHVAAAMGGDDEAKTCEVVSLLLKAGADCNAVDAEGLTPLVVAAASGRLGVVGALLPHTARPESVAEGSWDVQGVVRYAMQQVVAARSADGDAGSGPPSSSSSTTNSTPSSPGPGGRPLAVPEPEEPDVDAARKAQRKGDEAFVRGEFGEAVLLYSTSLRHDTRVAVVWSNRAAAHLRQGNASAALHDARIARTLAPTEHKAWFREGSALAALQQWEDAAQAHFEASHLAPKIKDYEIAFRSAVEEGRKAHRAASAAAAGAGGPAPRTP